MEIDPKIIAQMGSAVTSPPDDGICCPLRGSPKQLAWAKDLRKRTLSNVWPVSVAAMLRKIADSSWWIANEDIVNTLKFKPPSEHQMYGNERQPELPTAAELETHTRKAQASRRAAQQLSVPPPDKTVNAATGRITFKPGPPTEQRISDAEKWANSVAQQPDMAEAAILAVLYKLYKEPVIKAALKRRAEELLAAATVPAEPGDVVDSNLKDMDAIRRMLT